MALTNQYTNNTTGKLLSDITDVDTSCTLQAGQGSNFPTADGTSTKFKVTLVKSTGEREICVCKRTAGSDVISFIDESTGIPSVNGRAQEGTAALAFSANDQVELRLTAVQIQSFEDEIDDLQDAVDVIDGDYLTSDHLPGGSDEDDHDARYYTQSQLWTRTELAANGGAPVHSGNLTGKNEIAHSELTDDEPEKHFLEPESSVAYDVRPEFLWLSTASISIGGFRYHHDGTTEQVVKSDSAITFTFSGLGASEWHYLYLDDSAIVTKGDNIITATELINNTTAPTFSNSKLGWYNGNDRCIGAYYSNSGSNLDVFFQNNIKVQWDSSVEIFTTLTSSFAAKTFRAPAFCREVEALIQHINITGSSYYQHPDGTGNQLLATTRFDTGGDNQSRGMAHPHRSFMIDSNLQADFRVTGGTNVDCLQDAYILPRGM